MKLQAVEEGLFPSIVIIPKDLESVIVVGAAFDAAEMGMCGWVVFQKIKTPNTPWLLRNPLDILRKKIPAHAW